MGQTIKMLALAEAMQIPKDYAGDDTFEHNSDFPEYQPGVPKGTNIFIPPGVDKITVDACNDVSDIVIEFIDALAGGVCTAWLNWQSAAMISGMVINGPAGMVPPGTLSSPVMMNTAMILATVVPGQGANFMPMAKAVATGIETAWSAWEKGFTIQLQYPPFASVPAPTAPPTPNIPMPVITGSSIGDPMMKKAALSGLMLANLSGVTPDDLTQLIFDTFADGFCMMFDIWKASTMVSNVMGTGPVPSFAPPFSPVGPVVGGTNIPSPGIFI